MVSFPLLPVFLFLTFVCAINKVTLADSNRIFEHFPNDQHNHSASHITSKGGLQYNDARANPDPTSKVTTRGHRISSSNNLLYYSVRNFDGAASNLFQKMANGDMNHRSKSFLISILVSLSSSYFNNCLTDSILLLISCLFRINFNLKYIHFFMYKEKGM